MGKKLRNILQNLNEKLTYKQCLIIAGVISCILGVLVYLSLGNRGPEKGTEPKNTKNMVQVLAARENIQPRAVIKERMVTVIEVPEDAVPAGALTKFSDVGKSPAAIVIMKGDIITKQKLMADPKMAGFTGVIPPECRAISVGISDVTGVAGFANPGDYVDIMVVSGRKESGRLTGQLVMQNVLLLGINKTGGKADEKPSDATPGRNEDGSLTANREAMATATLALKPKDAVRLATVAQNGVIYLMLRPYQPRDNYVAPRDYVLNTENEQMRNQYMKLQVQQMQAPRPGNSGSSGGGSGSVEVIRGTTVTREGGR